MSNKEAPAPDVVEVSIFGPGKGESILVHLGWGKWIIIDSCIDQQTDSLPVIDYLRRLGVSVENDVLMVLGTHAHDDHIAGISRVFDHCSTAFYACPAALTEEDFVSVLEEDVQAELTLRRSIYSEFRKVQEIANGRRKTAGGKRFLKRAIEELYLLDRDWLDGSRSRVYTLSPSHEAVTRSLQRLVNAKAVAGRSRNPSPLNPNEFSIALWIESLGKVILLGGDVLKGPAGCGWAGILTEFKPTQRASLIKVPHHGAPNADEADVWEKLLEDNPVALLAPFRAGKRPRPDLQDRTRICSRTSNAFITASPAIPAPGREVKAQRAELGQTAGNLRDAWGRIGQVRARSRMGSSGWKIELFSPAQSLCQGLPSGKRYKRS
jgi:beta-lactamase superfamily II metal-dependent hydrolase